MRLPSASLSALILALAVAPLSLLVRAQDEPATEPAAAEEASAEAPAEAEAPAPAAKPITPRPSEMAVKATSNPLLKVVSTGKGYVAVGAHGHVLTSADGKAWKQVASPVSSTGLRLNRSGVPISACGCAGRTGRCSRSDRGSGPGRA